MTTVKQLLEMEPGNTFMIHELNWTVIRNLKMNGSPEHLLTIRPSQCFAIDDVDFMIQVRRYDDGNVNVELLSSTHLSASRGGIKDDYDITEVFDTMAISMLKIARELSWGWPTSYWKQEADLRQAVHARMQLAVTNPRAYRDALCMTRKEKQPEQAPSEPKQEEPKQ